MSTTRHELLHAFDLLLAPERFKDYGPNGLQVEGRTAVRKIVSGVTASLAALAAALIPATLRGVNQAIIFAAGHTGPEDDLDWTALARTGQPIVVYMAMRNLEATRRFTGLARELKG